LKIDLSLSLVDSDNVSFYKNYPYQQIENTVQIDDIDK